MSDSKLVVVIVLFSVVVFFSLVGLAYRSETVGTRHCYVCDQVFPKTELRETNIPNNEYEHMCKTCLPKFKKHTYLGE